MRQTVVMLLLLLVGCSPFRIVRNQADPAAQWSEYRTFAFVDTNRIAGAPGATYQIAVDMIKQAVASEMRERGFQPSTNNPDLLVNLGVVVQEKTQTRQTTIQEAPLYIGQRRYHWQSREVPVGTYEEGTINIHVVDAQRNALLWDAAVASVINRRSADPARIGEAVDRLFQKFPAPRP
ncbi:DUF4136 domain-containing protein [Nibrella viscosa]